MNLALVLAAAVSAAAPDPGSSTAMEQGRVMLKCTLHADGTLDPCEVESETPAGLGLGARALELAKRSHIYRARGPGQVRVPMVFQIIDEADGADPAAPASAR